MIKRMDDKRGLIGSFPIGHENDLRRVASMLIVCPIAGFHLAYSRRVYHARAECAMAKIPTISLGVDWPDLGECNRVKQNLNPVPFRTIDFPPHFPNTLCPSEFPLRLRLSGRNRVTPCLLVLSSFRSMYVVPGSPNLLGFMVLPSL